MLIQVMTGYIRLWQSRSFLVGIYQVRSG